MTGPCSEFNVGTYNDHERALHITGGAMLGPDHFHIAIEATPATAARIAAKLKLDPEILNDLLAEKNREIVRLRTILDRVSDAVISAAVVSRPLPEEFWPAIKDRQQIWNVAYGYGAMDCLNAIVPAIKS